MTRPLTRPSGRLGLCAALGVAMLCGVAAGCAGSLDPSILTGGGGSGNTSGAGGTGGPSVCDANAMFFPICTTVGCHSANTTGGAGLDLTANGLVGRLLNKGPSTNTGALAACGSYGKPYLVPNSNPATGLLIDKMSTSITCGTVMPQVGSVNSTQLSCLNAWATAVTTGVITQ